MYPSFTRWPLTNLSEDRKSEQVTRFIDVKSKLLCDILRRVLQDLRAVSVIGDKLSVSEYYPGQKSTY